MMTTETATPTALLAKIQSHLATGNVSVALSPETRPQFERCYRTTVGDGFSVEIKIWTGAHGGRYDRSSVTPRNGRSIGFDAKAVADKIIDRDLYPLVQEVTDKILAVDAAFVASNPSEFTDNAGTTWRRTIETRNANAEGPK